MELCECGHWVHCREYGPRCPVCGCDPYKPRHDPRCDPNDVADQGYADDGYPYSGMGKVRR